MLDWLAAIGGAGGIVAAIFAFLAYRSRHGVPEIMPVVQECSNCRYVDFQQRDGKDWWLIDSVRLARMRGKWLAGAGKPSRDVFGQLVSYSQDGEWRRKIIFSRPSGSQQLLVHPEAKGPLVFWLTVRLQANPFIKRRIKRPSFTPRV